MQSLVDAADEVLGLTEDPLKTQIGIKIDETISQMESFKTKAEKDFLEVPSKKGEDPSKKLSKNNEERKIDDASETLNKSLDIVLQKPQAKVDRKSEINDNLGKSLIQTKEKKIDTDNLLDGESNCKEIYMS